MSELNIAGEYVQIYTNIPSNATKQNFVSLSRGLQGGAQDNATALLGLYNGSVSTFHLSKDDNARAAVEVTLFGWGAAGRRHSRPNGGLPFMAALREAGGGSSVSQRLIGQILRSRGPQLDIAIRKALALTTAKGQTFNYTGLANDIYIIKQGGEQANAVLTRWASQF